ncbi:hypothetical protein GCM10010412_091470 [Nonomuraea recticatena]|uniref:Transglutaminase-like domain-containing protein n=2 Tax=Nonomuraea recticatena TaxID=46178 RepID=A0ABN3T9T3_9ACTN
MLRRVASVALTGLLAGTSGLAFDGVFPLDALVPVVVVASLVPSLLALLISGWLPLWASLAVNAFAWLVAVSIMVFRTEAWAGFLPSFASVRGALLGVRDAWKALLTTILPVEADSETVVLAHFLVWAAAMAGAETALRTRAAVLLMAPALPVLAAAVVLGVAGPGSSLPVATAFVGLALLLALVRSANSARTFMAGIPVLGSLLATAALIAPALPMAAEPYDVRELVNPPPPTPLRAVSPLDQISAWLQNPRRKLFTVSSATATNWRLATFDRFDGVTWSSSAGYLPTGGRIPAQANDRPRDLLDQRFTLQELPTPWLPAADRPVRASVKGLMVDPATGTLASMLARESTTYEVTSGLPRYSAQELREAVPAGNPSALLLPEGLDGRNTTQWARLRRIAQRATAGAISPMQQAVQLAAYLRKHAVNDVNSPPGHSYRSIEFFLTHARKGTTEQFATSYALLARSLGLPTRVVVGFRPGTPMGPGDVRQVLGGHVLAWAEVEFKEIGWVPFYPTPSRSRSGETGDAAEGVSKQRQEIERQISAEPAPAIPSPAPSATPTPASPSPPDGRGRLDTWSHVSAITLAGAATAYLLGVAALPPLRRAHRRRAGVPAVRVAGAWRQTVSRLRVVGVLASPEALTAHEVASLAASALGVQAHKPLVALAEVANLNRFGGTAMSQEEADAAWRHYETVDALVRQAIPVYRRLIVRLRPSSLIR